MKAEYDVLRDHLPRAVANVPRLALGKGGPTPVQAISLPDDCGVAEPPGGLWAKRDDLTGDLYGGNKVRKLEYILGDVLARGHDTVWTTGAIGSHHALATALYGRELGLEVHVLHFPQPMTAHVLKNLRAIVATGAHLRLASTRARVPVEVARDHVERWFAGRVREYIVPAGGSSPLGVLGYVAAAFELADQIHAGLLPCPRRIYVPFGSVGTFAGLWLGARLAKLPTEIIGVRVVDLLFSNEVIAAHLIRQTHDLLRQNDPHLDPLEVHPGDLSVRHTAFGDGYGEPTRAGQRAIEVLGSCGLGLDPTYTGKTAAAMLDDLARPNLRPDGPVLLWHTLSSVDLTPLAESVPLHTIPQPWLDFIHEHPGQLPPEILAATGAPA